jgi:hypothetical protein
MAVNLGNCHVCANQLTFGPDSFFELNGADVCVRCIKDTLDAPIAGQLGYPAVINGVLLHPAMFPAPFFGGRVAFERYKNLFDMKNAEWATPATLRLYCNCPVGMFLGARESLQARGETTYAGCGACMQVYCMKCGAPTDESVASLRAHRH